MHRTLHGGRSPSWLQPIGAAMLLALLCGCSGATASVADEEGFISCLLNAERYYGVDGVAIDLSDVDDWDRDREVAFWSAPAVLDCGVTRLTEAQRTDAFAGAFSAPSDDLPPGDLERQWQVVSGYTAWVYEEEDSSEVTLLRAGDLLATLWVADIESSGPASAMSDVATLALMQAQGDLPGFAPYLQSREDSSDDADWLLNYRDELGKTDEAGGDEVAYSRFAQLSNALFDRVRR